MIDSDSNPVSSIEYRLPCIVAVAALLARQLSQQSERLIAVLTCLIPDYTSACVYRRWVHLPLTPNPLPPPTRPPPAAPTWEARLPTLTMTTQASASSTLATTARAPPSPWRYCWKHGLSTPTLMLSSCPQALFLLLQVNVLSWPCVCVCLSIHASVSYVCAPVHLCDRCVGCLLCRVVF